MSTHEPAPVSRKMEISEWSGLGHTSTFRDWPHLYDMPSEVGGVPKGKSWSALQNMGRWRLAHCRGHGFKAYATLIILSLCILWCVSFFV